MKIFEEMSSHLFELVTLILIISIEMGIAYFTINIFEEQKPAIERITQVHNFEEYDNLRLDRYSTRSLIRTLSDQGNVFLNVNTNPLNDDLAIAYGQIDSFVNSGKVFRTSLLVNGDVVSILFVRVS